MVLKLGALKIEKLRNRLGLDFENNLYKSTKQVQAARAFCLRYRLNFTPSKRWEVNITVT